MGMKGRWSTTPSTLGVFINSANSIIQPETNSRDDDYNEGTNNNEESFTQHMGNSTDEDTTPTTNYNVILK